MVQFLRNELSIIMYSNLFNTYSLKQPDLYYFETRKMTSQASHGEYEPQASILCEL